LIKRVKFCFCNAHVFSVKRTFSMDNPGFDERPKDSTLLSIEKEKDALANIDHSHFERRKLSTLPTSEEFNDDEDDDSDADITI